MLARIARPGGGVVAVVANAGPLARCEVDVDASPCPINPLRLAVAPTVLDAATIADIAEILRVAEDDGGANLDDPPYDTIELSVERPLTARVDTVRGSQPGRFVPAIPGPDLPDLGDPPILVRVLGSVEVDGALECKRAKSRELIVYLAMHPNGVGESELDEALWGSNGGRIVLSSTRDSTVSVARTALGGASRLLPAQGQGREKRYQFGPEVQSDWQQFCTLHRFGREQQSTAALRQALELVRGRPFEAVISGRTYGWIHTEGHGRHIEAEVADAADLAASLYLKAGDPLAARWAARRGLLAEPYTERLWVRLMEAADELGESQEIERIMDEMDIVLELGGDFTGLHPNTLAVYDRLSRRRRFPAET
jgi:DNA-binding SARP family transcriptional activator